MGVGGFGSVYAAKSVGAGVCFALKSMDKKRVDEKKAEQLCLAAAGKPPV